MHRQSIPCCKSHYGSGIDRFYRGPVYNQSGAGFFGDLFRRVLPLVSQKVAPYIGKQLLETGRDIASEIQEGRPIGKAVKSSMKRAYHRGKSDLSRKLTGHGYKKRRKTRDAFSL